MHDEPATAADVQGTVNALSTIWALLLTDLERAGQSDGAPTLLPYGRATVDRLAARASMEAPGITTAADLPRAIDAVAPYAAATLRAPEPTGHDVLLDVVTGDLQAAGRALHAAGYGVPTQTGAVVQVSSSAGGVPKAAVPRAQVGLRGLLDDRQDSRRHHGRPFQALCLWSLEVIEALQAEGHPIHPGAAGENITVRGIDWASLRPGTRLRIGTVLAEVSAPALPCSKNAQWFLDGDFERMHHERHPGWSRLYAWVLEPGQVATGDAVVVEPTT